MGISTPIGDLYQRIADAGWELKKVAWDDKSGEFYAIAADPMGKELYRSAKDEKTALGHLVMAIGQLPYHTANRMVTPWGTHFLHKLEDIAKAYANGPIYDPKAAAAFKGLADDASWRLPYIQKHIVLESTNHPSPYKSMDEFHKDLKKKRHLFVSEQDLDHPLWTPEQVQAFRVNHHVFGHGAANSQDMGWEGSNAAFAHHAPLLSPEAQGALFSQTLAPLAYQLTHGQRLPQKITLFPQFVDNAREIEHPGVHWPVHPAQSPIPQPEQKIKDETWDNLI